MTCPWQNFLCKNKNKRKEQLKLLEKKTLFTDQENPTTKAQKCFFVTCSFGVVTFLEGLYLPLWIIFFYFLHTFWLLPCYRSIWNANPQLFLQNFLKTKVEGFFRKECEGSLENFLNFSSKKIFSSAEKNFSTSRNTEWVFGLHIHRYVFTCFVVIMCACLCVSGDILNSSCYP